MTRLLLSLLAAVLPAQEIDRPARPEEWGYRPADAAPVETNPPSFSWTPVARAESYEVQWASDRAISRPAIKSGLKWTVYTHNAPLKPGTWYWRYRAVVDGQPTAWSSVRQFDVSSRATVFPQPTLAEVKPKIAASHPRVFLRQEDLPRLRQFAQGSGRPAWDRLSNEAARLAAREPTTEPKVKANNKDPETNQFWWSNRVQTLKAAYEAETLAFVWLLSGDEKWREPARKYMLALAGWDPDGPTNFRINCEAAKPLVHRLARIYDWGYGLLSESEREKIRKMILRRATDAWMSGEVRQGVGHLAEPYNSHGNRTWHKLAEAAVALMGEAPEADAWLDYALTKYWAAYPAWADDDGGWHEGLSYWAGYMVKTTWWMHLARTSLGLDPYRKPFFKHFADYALYSAPPGSPEMGFGDLSHRPPSPGWAFIHYFIRDVKNPYWAWWAKQWKIADQPEEPVLGFLWGEMPPVAERVPTALPASKLFSGIGVAITNSTLTDAAANVQVRFKSSPMGRRSHGHDPHNSFTLNAYGEALLVNNVYRDLYGSPFHAKWCWETVSQNAMLVDGAGQVIHSAGPGGKILAAEFKEGAAYVAGEAAEAYRGKLKRYVRHMLHIKPDLVVMVDEAEAAAPSRFQFMLHGLREFNVDAAAQRLKLERGKAGVIVDYIAEEPLAFRQWSGYEPAPDERYLGSIGRQGSIPVQWHVEAATRQSAMTVWNITVMRPYKTGAATPGPLTVQRSGATVRITAPDRAVSVELRRQGTEFAIVRSGGREVLFTRGLIGSN